MRQNIQAYKKVNIESTLLNANPHQVILMLMNGVLDSISEAKGAIERKDYVKKAELLTKAINIFQALQNSLDHESQPEISNNFFQLYDYCIQRINDVNINLDISGVVEVTNLLKPLRDAWLEMPQESKEEGFSLLKEKDKAREAKAI